MKKTVLFIECILCLSTLSAQEFILEPQSIKDTRNIVREVEKNVWLAANYYDGNQMGCFFLNDNVSSNFTAYDAGFLIVHDLEVLEGKTAFYCGERRSYRHYSLHQKDSSYIPEDDEYTIIGYDTLGGQWVIVKRTRAVMGYFSIDVPNRALYDFYEMSYFPNFHFRDFDKLELLPVSDGIHVIMTGITRDGHGSLLDAATSSVGASLWDYTIDTTTDGTLYDDVAITDKYVVVSRRKPLISAGAIDYYYCSSSYSLPTVGGNTTMVELSHSVNDTLLLEHCEEDAFVAATYSQSENGIVVSAFNAMTELAHLRIPLSSTINPIQQLVDIKYDEKQVLGVLQHDLNNDYDTTSIIWHLFPSHLPYGGIVYGKKYDRENLYSLDRQKNNLGLFIASGHRERDSGIYRLYQHEVGPDEQCSKIVWQECTAVNAKTLQQDYVHPLLYEVVEPHGIMPYQYIWDVLYKCKYESE